MSQFLMFVKILKIIHNSSTKCQFKMVEFVGVRERSDVPVVVTSTINKIRKVNLFVLIRVTTLKVQITLSCKRIRIIGKRQVYEVQRY